MIQTQARIELPMPHPGQLEILQSPARFKVVACGRRWGKTTSGLIAVTEALLLGKFVWWVMPAYPDAVTVWGIIKDTLAPITTNKSEQNKIIDVLGGGRAMIKSGDRPEGLRGVGLDLVVVDEAAFINKDVWYKSLRATLSDKEGSAMILSTPKGKNWFYREWTRGMQGHTNYQSFHFPTSSSPTVTLEEVEAARYDLPEHEFLQEYEAAFLDDGGVVFRNIRACIYDVPTQTGQYVQGVDLGKSGDFSVITTVDVRSGHVVDIDRFNQVDYVIQSERIKSAYLKWRPQAIYVEKNAMGDAVIDFMRHNGIPVRAFDTTNKSKQNIVQALVLAFERETIRIPKNDTLISELEAFESKRLPSGVMAYSAPSGMHDDMVMSLAIAWYHAQAGAINIPAQPSHDSRWQGVSGRRRW